MSVITADGAPDVLLVEFELAHLDLAAATAALRHKDTPAARGTITLAEAVCVAVSLLGRRVEPPRPLAPWGFSCF